MFMTTQVIGDYCKICGDGVQLGNKCTFCEKSPFCDQCSERNDPFKRVCNECKEANKLECFSCDVLCEIRCGSCKKLVEKGVRDKVNNACVEHMRSLFVYDGLSGYFTCKNCNSVCRYCVEEKGFIFKHYSCKNCNSELIKNHFGR